MRVGKSKQPSYRVVVADSRSPRDGRIIEAIGHYQPRKDPSEVAIDEARAVYWLGKGAQPSDQVRNLLRITGAWSAFTGEAPPQPVSSVATPAASVRATPAASVAEGGEGPAGTPEAADVDGAAPEAPGDDDTDK